MSDRDWLGRARAVAQVSTATVGGTIEATDIFILTINGKSLSVVGGSTDANTVRTAIIDAWNLVEDEEFAEITAAAGSGTGEITLTADTAGVPFTVTASTTETGGGTADDQTFTVSTTTAATGPNHWDNANNWSGGAVPVNSDDVTISKLVPILYGLDQSSVTLTSLTISATFASGGTIGLPKVNASGYTEYRDDYLKISATTLRIGTGEGSGSGRIKINLGSAQTAAEVRATGSSLDTNIPAVLLLGTHASNTLDVSGGSVGVAIYPGEVSTFTTVRSSKGTTLQIGSGVTLGTATFGGTVRMDCASTTTNVSKSSSVQLTGSGTVGTLNVDTGGTCKYESSGTVTAANIAGTVDCTGDSSARTFTTTTIKPGGKITDPQKTITHTNDVALSADVTEVSAT